MLAIEIQEPAVASVAANLNAECRCSTLDREALLRRLDEAGGREGLGADLGHSHPHLFSATTVFVSQATADRIATTVLALERTIALPAYQAQALARAPEIARLAHGPQGVLMGYDFHVGKDGPRLIEINTNAGGLLLNLALARAQRECCAGREDGSLAGLPLDQLESRVLAMFREEWRLQRGDARLRSIAIIDDDPGNQYLAPEFAMFRRLCERAGLDARIADARALEFRDGRLRLADLAIDLGYNRLTDFALADPAHAALRAAYEAGAVVLTPHPRAHAVYADKRNLAVLGDAAALARLGVGEADRRLLEQVVPVTVEVAADNAERLWPERRHWFFKPAGGYGSKAAYRGDKLTRRVWDEIRAGGYIAQRLVPPAERAVQLDRADGELKFDLRAYTYAGEILLLAARTWAGQTTNFRTPGGGFAPVVVV